MKKKKISQHQLFISYSRVWKALVFPNLWIWDNKFWTNWKITLIFLLTWPIQMIEYYLFRKKIKKVKVVAPIFILGHWRSGTTHLHYLMTSDPQFGYLTNFQAFLFNISLLGGKWLSSFTNRFFPKNRIMDNMLFGTNYPAEEELPLSNVSLCSAYHSMWFPKEDSFFEKYALFSNISLAEKLQWQKDYSMLLQKIAFSNKGKALVLKNPLNTSRIQALLKLYPNAKFIFIHRNPIDVFYSTLHWYEKVVKSQFLQSFSDSELKEKTIRYYKQLMQAYLDQRKLIPDNQLVEISFQALEQEPLQSIKIIYKKLNLAGFENAQSYIENYIDQTKSYKKNKFEIKKEDLITVKEEWKFAFDEFKYPLN